MKNHTFRATLCCALALSSLQLSAQTDQRPKMADEIERSLRTELLDAWYPRSSDKKYGGFLSAFTFDFKAEPVQDKMIVTQSRHVWTNAKAYLRYPTVTHYKSGAANGFNFLKDVMWDSVYGGFHTLVDQRGNAIKGSFAPKEAYGNAFALFALAAYYQAFGDTSALNLAKKQFGWLERHSHDPVHKGYFQHMQRDGTPIKRAAHEPGTSVIGYKDQNTSIHMLEALTELYGVWPDARVRERLEEMLVLIRDRITSPAGHMTLFFHPDWTPVSFRDSSEQFILAHLYVDHVSFGHDVETAFLLIEASHALGYERDEKTHTVAKKMVDHALINGWDRPTGGIYDAGYYFRNKTGMTIIHDTKNWWAQAEALNTLLLMADLYPEDPLKYFEKFLLLWGYINAYLIDHEFGDWYAGGLDKEPHHKQSPKGHIWKAAYHQYRSLVNCVQRLRPDRQPPKTPTRVRASGSIMQWLPATDDRNLAGYNIYRNRVRVLYTPLTAIRVKPESGVRYTVRAVDLHGNESEESEAVTF